MSYDYTAWKLCIRTVRVAIMGGDFLAELDRLDDTEGDIFALTKKLAVVVAIVLKRTPLKKVKLATRRN